MVSGRADGTAVMPQPAESKRDSSRNICACPRRGQRAKATVEIADQAPIWRGDVPTLRVTARAGDRGVVGSHSQASSSARLVLDRLRRLRATLCAYPRAPASAISREVATDVRIISRIRK